ncbi:MAG: RagB/SusD family nutrient uptake outer membrane protein [Paludibacter sp.]|nr:RagB/SusD family nutrient uptake outer membrane protein [Paludibacter sp.]
MMKIKYLSTVTILISVMFLFTFCNDLNLHYEGGTEDIEQITDAVNAIPSRANATLNGMYSLLSKPYVMFGLTNVTYGRADDMGYMAVTLGQDLNSGDMVNIVSGYDWFSVALEYSDRTPTYANPQIRYGLFYKILYATNEVLDMVPDGTEDAALKAIRGQAEAMRAFSYLSLAPYFQFKYKGNENKPSVPMMKEGVDFRNNPRVPLSELYEAIVQDLTDAISDLDGFVRANKGQIDQRVAYGLRARAYLYMEEWDKAAADADKAMSGYSPYSSSEIQTPGFCEANDHNWIWAALIPADVIGDELASWPSQIGSFSSSSYVAYAGIWRSINKLLYDKIPATDVRKAWWLNASKYSPNLNGLSWTDYANNITYNGQDIVNASIPDTKVPMTAYANVKFGQRSGIGATVNDGDWCMMRAEEMILIKAEAAAKAGRLAEGRQILENFVKSYRDPSYTSTAANVDNFSNEVWLQRRIELWGEGFAMADIMRLGKNVVRFHPGAVTNVPESYQFNIAANDPWLLLRFVQRETTNNVAIEQNEGGTQPTPGNGASLLDGVTD